MPGTATIGRVRWPTVLALALASLPFAAAEERKTVAYFVGMPLLVFRHDLSLGYSGPGEPPAPVRLKNAPAKSRFFGEGDELWDVSEIMVRGIGLRSKAEWAVFNNTTRRLVIRGDREVHWLHEQKWSPAVMAIPMHIVTRVRLLKVSERGLRLVSWNEKLLKQRQGEEVIVMESIARPGQKGSLELQGGGMTGSLTVEVQGGGEDEMSQFIDAKLDFAVELDGGKSIELKTELAMWAGVPVYVELGSGEDSEHTFLLEIGADFHFMDGRMSHLWREYEEPRHQPSRPKPYQYREPTHKKLDDGMVLGIWPTFPMFLDVLLHQAGADPDPFGGDDAGLGGPQRRDHFYTFPKPPSELAEDYGKELLIDLGKLLAEEGIEVSEGGWAIYAPKRNTLLTKLEEKQNVLVAELVSGLLYDPPAHIGVTLCPFEWNGDGFEPGTVPKNAKRLGRTALTLHPGREASLTVGVKSDGKLLEGFTFNLEASVGANSQIVDLKYDYVLRGESQAKSGNSLVLQRRRPLVVPMGRVKGRTRGLVVEAVVTEVTGEPRR